MATETKGQGSLENSQSQTENNQESVIFESDSSDLRPSGSLTLGEDGKIRVGGWDVDRNGFYVSSADGDETAFERRKALYLAGGGFPNDPEYKARRKEMLEKFRSAYDKLLEQRKAN